MTSATYWRECNTCKKPIAFGQRHFVCSVSTCNQKRMALVFCSTRCWDSHLPIMRHREAWAVEEHAPSREVWEKHRLSAAAAAPEEGEAAPRRERKRIQLPQTPSDPAVDTGPIEILVVASRLKKYISERFGLKTSESVLPVLSDHLRELCAQAADEAGKEMRKTVLDRDFRAIL